MLRVAGCVVVCCVVVCCVVVCCVVASFVATMECFEVSALFFSASVSIVFL